MTQFVAIDKTSDTDHSASMLFSERDTPTWFSSHPKLHRFTRFTRFTMRKTIALSIWVSTSMLGLAAHSIADTSVPTSTENTGATCDIKNPAIITPGTSSASASSCAKPGNNSANQTRQSQTLPASIGETQAPTFVLRKIVLKGAKLISEAELSKLYSDKINQTISLSDLETITEKITQAYHSKNFFLAQAIIPANQDVTEGLVEISVIEGVLGKIRIKLQPGSPITEQAIQQTLSILEPGKALDGRRYERAMLLLSDTPGIKAQSILEQGLEPGTADLVVDVSPTPRTSYTAEVDNYGAKASGRIRVGGSARINSPFSRGDNLDARLLVAQGANLTLGRIAYETPINNQGWRVGLGFSRIDYQLGEEFAALDAQGKANILDVSLSYPLIRQRNRNLFLRASLENKQLADELRNFGSSTDKTVKGLGLGWTHESRDSLGGGGYWSTSGTLYHGYLKLNDAASQIQDSQADGPGLQVDGPQAAGHFTKFSWRAARLQAIGNKHLLFFSANGTLSNKNLDPSEKLALGGPNAVRAYPSGESLVDRGILLTTEWRYPFSSMLTGYVFYDYAHGKLLHSPTVDLTSGNSRTLKGPGLGFSWMTPYIANLSINTTLAWRQSGGATTDNNSSRPSLFCLIQKTF
ncbi:MAG: ShlB/FhaC/HecB family hemolysin secretion/activation protein [Pseudomonadota bacterium]